MSPDSPIGVFDSGIGGLTVLKEIKARLPHENIIYFGDTARVPYGIKSGETVTRFSREISEYLVGQGVKMLVVACNTASSVALPTLRDNYPLPVIGVLMPGAYAAARATKSERVGVIGTEGTVNSGAYARLIRNIRSGTMVFAHACPLFVPLVEEGRLSGPITRLAAEEYLAPLMLEDIDTLVLGCTHYPLLKETIAGVMGPEVELIDSAFETAREVERVLDKLDMLNKSGAPGNTRYAVSDAPERFKRIGERFLGYEVPEVEKVEL
ncbi:MAG: glutamate racemase [Nitrospirae bacterium]|nr:glutamate racemase [Nitrospirota bacterium]